MFKKSLIAVAALSALAGSAMAADVQIYGRIDTGLRLTGVNYDSVANMDDETNFEMASGNYTGSRLGIKGSEDLGNGLTVGFVLENGFDSDTGAQKCDGLFGREAIVYLEGDFGKIAAGKMGIMNSTAGSFAIGNFNPFGTGWGEVGSQNQIWGAGFETRYNNMISYRSPDFAGFKVHAQYSFGGNFKDGKVVGEEGKTTTNRYYGLGVTYTNGGLNLIGIVDSVNEAQKAGEYEKEDTFRVTVGGSYDFGVVKPYLAAAYFKDGQINNPFKAHVDVTGAAYASGLTNKDWEGYGVTLGATAPVLGGKAHAMVGYLDAEGEDTEGNGYWPKDDFKRWLVGFGYEYSLSKRTTVYADAGYFKDEYKSGSENIEKSAPDAYQAAVGLVHMF